MARNQPGMQLPARPSAQPGLPQNFQLLTFDGFDGLNTKATRPAIGDQEMSWCDNFMPLGPNNLRAMRDITSPLFTAASGLSVSHFHFANIRDTTYGLAFLDDGSIRAFSPSTGQGPQIAGPGTIDSPSVPVGATQWGSQYVVISAPQTNGYFLWDGTEFYQAGTIGPYVELLNGGFGYASVPDMTAVGGANGTGAKFSATLSSTGVITQITVLSAGGGYQAVDDTVAIIFSGGAGLNGARATAWAQCAISGGSIRSVNLVTGGSGYTTNANLSGTLYGGGGVGAAVVSASVLNGEVVAVVVSSGQGYTSAPVVVFSDPDNPVAEATVTVMPFGLQGTAAESYVNRIFMSNGAAPTTPPEKSLNLFSAPGSPTNFSTADGGGQFLSTDSFTRVGVHALKQTNGFLYMLADSSINYISGVQTSGDPPTTTFSNQNIDPQIGCPWLDTVQVFNRTIVFANTQGVYAIYGGAVQKVSSALDGIYTSVSFSGSPPAYSGFTPSAALATIYGISCYVLLLPIIDPVSGAQRNALLIWDGKRWFTSTQSVELTHIASLEIDSVVTCWGTDGHNIYELFKNASTAITKRVRSKLWDAPSYMVEKHSQQVYCVFQTDSAAEIAFTISVDTENGSASVNGSNVFTANWLTEGGAAVNWVTEGGAAVTWLTVGLSVFNGAVDAKGYLMGLTFETTAADITLVSIAAAAQQYTIKF